MVRNFVVAAALSTGLLAGAAGAADIVVSAPEVPVATSFEEGRFSWDGFYGGVQAGYGWIDAKSSFFSTNADGFIGGAYAGYLFRLGQNFYAGPELGAEFSTLSEQTFDFDHLLSARVKGGYAVDRALFTASVGVSSASYSSSVLGDYSDISWFVGAGVDYAITDHLTAGIDATWHKFDDFDGTGVDIENTILRGRLGYKF